MNHYFLARLKRLAAFLVVNYYVRVKTNKTGITNNEEVDVYLWLPRFGWRYYINDKIIKDYAKINALSNCGIKFKIVKRNNIGKIAGKTIHLNYSALYNKTYQFNDYTKQLQFLVQQLEDQGNKVFPSSNEIFFWENKGYMHKKFKKYNISEPETVLCQSFENVKDLKWNYPFLIKEEHSSASVGVHKIESINDLDFHEKKSTFKPNEYIIVQKLINMRKDLRVIIVGNEIVHFYWRINNQKEWRPTSTGRGSSVDFDFFPEQWRSFLINEFSKLNIPTGAFDVAWENDDLSSIPLILEVSPTYQLNPKITNKKHLENYGHFKQSPFFGRYNYINQYIEQTYGVMEKIILQYR